MEDDEQEPLTIYRLSKVIFIGPILIAGLGTAALWYVWTSNLNLMNNLGLRAAVEKSATVAAE